METASKRTEIRAYKGERRVQETCDQKENISGEQQKLICEAEG